MSGESAMDVIEAPSVIPNVLEPVPSALEAALSDDLDLESDLSQVQSVDGNIDCEEALSLDLGIGLVDEVPEDAEDLAGDNELEEDASNDDDEDADEEDESESSDGSEDESSDESDEGTEDELESEESGSEEKEADDDEVKVNEVDGDLDMEPPPGLDSIVDDPIPIELDTENKEQILEDITDTKAEDKTDEEVPVKPKKLKRKRKTKSKSDKPKKKAKTKSSFRRKNIRQIMKETQLDAKTVEAQNEELERKRRLMEIKKSIMQKSLAKPEEKDFQLKSLLQVAEEEAEKASTKKEIVLLDKEDKKVEKEEKVKDKDTCVIDVSSSSEEEEPDECFIVPSDPEEEEIEEEDLNNGGAHINDDCNRRDDMGRVQVNIGHPPFDPDVYLAPQIARAIKPHQIGGVRFLYDNLVESLARFKTSSGFGCILAHSMGLGKTIQMIGFIDIFLRYTDAKTAVCIVPINTLQNWNNEFNMWLPVKKKEEDGTPDILDVLYRSFQVFVLNDSYKTTTSRAKVICEWYKNGGVLLMGYEMYRLLSSRRAFPIKPKKSKKKTTEPEVIDVEEEDMNKTLMIDIHGALVNPGPDLVVCDEGHRIKNSHAGISQALKNIRTRRRVVLTGYPLQNNLVEYWCMVDFVRPSFLGTKTEFTNMFERPIMNGQCADSTPQDIKLMRYRAYVLHSLLEGFVQRRGHTVLKSALPAKYEYVFLIRMSPVQRALYNKFMGTLTDSALCAWANNNPLKAFAVCCKIWNHPDVLHKVLKKNEIDDNDLDIDTETGTIKKKTNKPLAKAKSDFMSDRKVENAISYEWSNDILKEYTAGLLDNGGKMAILYSIIRHSLAIGDKVLVFSQSLLTLSIVEEFLGKVNVPRPEMNEQWARNKSYFRLDGSTSGTDREKLINSFNDPTNERIWLFLLSTRAGCLGINLIGANRVIVLDASWNPCHDCQAVCRVFRFGQKKNSYVYRFVTDNTMEKKIYDRQISKQGMSDRVVDELNPENKFTSNQVGNLLVYEDKDLPEIDFSGCELKHEDVVLSSVLNEQGKWLTKDPFIHESLLIDRKELRLTKREKQLAKEGYARDKKMNVSYSRPSYSAFYPRGAMNQQNSTFVRPYIKRIFPSRPVASVKPMISTPVPMRLRILGDKSSQFGSLVRPGVTVHQVITTTDIVLPGNNTNTQAGMPRRIPAGQNVLIIKTLKGVYIRTSDGKLFAVRSKNAKASIVNSVTGVISSSTSTATQSTARSLESITTTTTASQLSTVSAQTQSKTETDKPPAGNVGTNLFQTIFSQTKAVNDLLKSQQMGSSKITSLSVTGASGGTVSVKKDNFSKTPLTDSLNQYLKSNQKDKSPGVSESLNNDNKSSPSESKEMMDTSSPSADSVLPNVTSTAESSPSSSNLPQSTPALQTKSHTESPTPVTSAPVQLELPLIVSKSIPSEPPTGFRTTQSQSPMTIARTIPSELPVTGSRTIPSESSMSVSRSIQSESSVADTRTVSSESFMASMSTIQSTSPMASMRTIQSASPMAGMRTIQSASPMAGMSTIQSASPMASMRTIQSASPMAGFRTIQSALPMAGMRTIQSASPMAGMRTIQSASPMAGMSTIQSASPMAGIRTVQSASSMTGFRTIQSASPMTGFGTVQSTTQMPPRFGTVQPASPMGGFGTIQTEPIAPSLRTIQSETSMLNMLRIQSESSLNSFRSNSTDSLLLDSDSRHSEGLSQPPTSNISDSQDNSVNFDLPEDFDDEDSESPDDSSYFKQGNQAPLQPDLFTGGLSYGFSSYPYQDYNQPIPQMPKIEPTENTWQSLQPASTNTSKPARPNNNEKKVRKIKPAVKDDDLFGGLERISPTDSPLSQENHNNVQPSIPPNPFLAAGLGGYSYPPFMAPNPGLGYQPNFSMGMPAPVSMMPSAHPGMYGAGMGQSYQQPVSSQTLSSTSSTPSSSISNQGQTMVSAGPSTHIPYGMPYQQGMYGLPPAPMSYSPMHPFGYAPSAAPMYMPMAMPPMINQPMNYPQQQMNHMNQFSQNISSSQDSQNTPNSTSNQGDQGE